MEVQLLLLFSSKDVLKSKGGITIHIRIGDILTNVLFTVAKNLTIDVLLLTVFIDEQILAILVHRPKVAVRRRTSVVIVKQHDLSAIAVFINENTQSRDRKTQFGLNRWSRTNDKTFEHNSSRQAEVSWTRSVTMTMAIAKLKRLLHFEPDLNLFTQRCMPVKGVVEAFPDRPFFIPVTNTSTIQEHFDKKYQDVRMTTYLLYSVPKHHRGHLKVNSYLQAS